MKVFFFSLFLIHIFGAICPNKCNSNGKCTKSGDCECNPGFEGYDCRYRQCPVGPKIADGTLIECSGNGYCDRDTGNCKCFDGYDGSKCENIACPNGCSNHGVCVSSSMARYVTDSNYPHYEFATNTDKNKLASVFVCVCESDYTGYDCSEKKCPLGYKKIGICDAPQDLQMKLKIPKITVTSPSPSPSPPKATPAGGTYIEYTDPFGSKWYSKRIELAEGSKVQKYGNDEMSDTPTIDKDIIDWSSIEKDPPTESSLDQFKWCYVFVDFLYTLPPGTIDLKNTTLHKNDVDKITSGCILKSDGIYIQVGPTTTPPDPTPPDPAFTVILNFGKDQTGDQSGIRLITSNDHNTVDSGIINTNNLISHSGGIIADSSRVTPSICSGFGYCDKTTGKCKCYDGYKGYACNNN